MRKAEIVLDYQNYFDYPEQQKTELIGSAAKHDGVTINHWRETWIKNVKKNHEFFGNFASHGVGELFGKHRFGTMICVGSGPSLGYNGHELARRSGVPVVSALHNFAFLEDLGAGADYYVSLDAGPVVIPEMSEAGKQSPEYYWELSKNRTLVAFIGSDPELFQRWQGKIYLFNCPVSDQEYIKTVDELEGFNTLVCSGGNVLGACVYLAKAIFGAHRIGMVGADFSFGYDKASFYPWQSGVNGALGQVIPLTDVFGIKVPAWPSYAGFKHYFEYLALHIPGNWLVNCSEGGCLGSYPQGNMRQINQIPLREFLNQLTMSDAIKESCENPATPNRLILY